MPDGTYQPIKRRVLTPCECGSVAVDLEYGESIRCRKCGTVPAEVTADPLDGEYQYIVTVEDEEGVIHGYSIAEQRF